MKVHCDVCGMPLTHVRDGAELACSHEQDHGHTFRLEDGREFDNVKDFDNALAELRIDIVCDMADLLVAFTGAIQPQTIVERRR